MVARHYSARHRFVCLTDRAREIPGVIALATKPVGDYFAWWKKLELFATPELNQGRVVYLDLDTIVVSDLSPIVDYPAPFALIPHAGTFTPKPPHRVVRRFNSSCMVWDGGTLGKLFYSWSPADTLRLWGDQDFIGEQVAPNAAQTFPVEWFPRLSELRGAPSPAAKVVLCKKPKNEEAAKRFRWVFEAWA